MKKRWIVEYLGPPEKLGEDKTFRPRLHREFWTLTEASLFRTVMEGNIPIGDRRYYTFTIWHKDDVR